MIFPIINFNLSITQQLHPLLKEKSNNNNSDNDSNGLFNGNGDKIERRGSNNNNNINDEHILVSSIIENSPSHFSSRNIRNPSFDQTNNFNSYLLRSKGAIGVISYLKLLSELSSTTILESQSQLQSFS